MMTKEWFSSWFDSPYYHLLYASRDEQEAKHFIEALQAHLKIAAGAFVLDAACGKGRHAKMLQRHGMHVEGFDLSHTFGVRLVPPCSGFLQSLL